jgi:fatty-acyl-CoA synthase
MQRHQVTHWTNLPTMVTDLLALPDPDGTGLPRAFSSMVYIGGGGTAMPEAVATRLHELTGLEYQEGWGLTEVAGAIHLNPSGGERRQCLGIPIFGVDTRVVATDGSPTELPAGEPGELITRCPSLFSGYWANDSATEQAFMDLNGQRYFRTGDIGRKDDAGYFYMADRLKRMISASGFKVWPVEVESTLFKHPAVQEACVIGTHDERRGETVEAFLVLKPGAEAPTLDAFSAWCREHMAAYKVPRVIEFVDALPKSGTGKVMWRQLQEAERGQG